MKNLLIILTADLISDEMKLMFGEIPPVMLPYNEQTVLEGIYEKNKKKFDIQMLGYKKIELIKDIVKKKKLNIKVKKIKEFAEIEKTILEADYENYENLTILFGDTIIKNWDISKYSGDKIAFNVVEEAEKWTTFSFLENKLEIYDKERRKFQKNYKAFSGIFSFSNPEMFFKLLVKKKKIYQAIVEYNKIQKIDFIKEDNWIDLGHLDEFNKNKEVASRYFNEIIIDREKGILTKKSKEKEKFINEIKWYLKIPKELEYMIPRIFSYDLAFDNPEIKMEYYSYLTLHNVFIHGNYSINKWDKIFDLLLKTNQEFQKYKLKLSKEKIDLALQKIYVDKTIQRLELLKKDKEFISFFEGEITINGKKYQNLEKIIKKIPEVVKKKLLNIDELTIIHGDYFFANILYDTNSNFIRLIDPRGDFGGYGIYGDPRYDLAKLSHSVNGKYDFIVSDKFSIEDTSSIIEFEINYKEDYDDIKELFFDKIKEKKEEIALIEALLFLSMIPLHKDFPERQKIMLAIGVTLIAPYLKGTKND